MKTENKATLILSRLKNQLKIKTDVELSEIMAVKPNTISTWKKRGSVDYDKIIDLCQANEIDLNIIFSDCVFIPKETNDFEINKIAEHYSNVKMANDSDDETVHFYITDKNGSDFAEVMFRPDDRYWRIIKDNFPMPRAGYAFDIPIKNFGQFERYFADLKIQLIKK